MKKELEKWEKSPGFKGHSGRGGGPPPGGGPSGGRGGEPAPQAAVPEDNATEYPAMPGERKTHEEVYNNELENKHNQAAAQADDNKTAEQKESDNKELKDRAEKVNDETESKKEKDSPGRYRQWRADNNKGPMPAQHTKDDKTILREYNAWWDYQWKKFKTGKSPLPVIRHKQKR